MMLLKILPRMQDVFDNRVCCIMGHGPMGEKLEEAGVLVYYLNLKNIFDLGIIFRFKKLIREFEPEILITYLIHADLFGRIFGRIFGIKKIICSVRVKLIQLKYLPLLFLDALTSPLVTHYHFNSQAVANMYHTFFFLSKRKITIIPNGLEVEKYQVKINANKKKDKMNIPRNKFIIGCIGRLEKQKGQKYLLKAFVDIVNKFPDSVLIFVGDGSDRKKLEKISAALGVEDSVFFLGKRNDIHEILQIIDVFVLPSLYEGMSNALLEAMAAGKIIIATDIPENKELIENGVSGILVPARSSHTLAKAILDIFMNKPLIRSIKLSAKKEALEKFSLKKTTQEMIYFFKNI